MKNVCLKEPCFAEVADEFIDFSRCEKIFGQNFDG